MTLSEELEWRGLVNQSTLADIRELDESSVKFYWGVDPSADSMTIGNLASAMLVKHFINYGHKATLLVGGATGLIGDPDGKKDERNLKTREEVERNKAAIAAQYSQVFAGQDFEVVDNFDWFKDVNFIDFLSRIGKHVPMNQMLSRDFVQSRLDTTGISYAEFSYSLIQAYDFLHLYLTEGVTLQLCGSDQWGNSTAGVSLIRRIAQGEAHVFTTPLVVNKATGVKFGKSENGAVWLDGKKTSPYQFYQFWLNVADDAVVDLLKVYTMLSREQISALEEETKTNPRNRSAQKVLAREVTILIHGAERVAEVECVIRVLFSGDGVQDLNESELATLAAEVPTVYSPGLISQILQSAGITESLGAGRRLIKNGGVTVNGVKAAEDFEVKETSLLKIGKNKFVFLKVV